MAATQAAGWLRSSAVRLAFRESGRAAAAAKKGAKPQQQKKEKGGEKGLTGSMALHAKILEARGEAKYERSAEQMAKDSEIAKTYTRNMFRRHIEESKWLTKKIKLRDQAIAALPVELQEEGREMDYRPAPMDRHIWTEFPPIPGFGELEHDDDKDTKDKKADKKRK